MTDPTVWRTPHRLCPACQAGRLHDESERTLYHPFARHGYNGTGQWSHPSLDPEYLKKWAQAKAAGGPP